ncbi:MAG: SpoIIE family protein phosphatase [Candidatus Krumholzibacteriia bacterium]
MTDARDALGRAAWQVLLAGMFTTLGAALLALRQDAGPAAAWVASGSWCVAWLVLARFRFFSFKRRWPWLVGLALIWLLALQGSAGAFGGMLLALPFMLRQQASLHLISSRRRALVFLAAVLLFGATFTGGLGRPEGRAGDLTLFTRVGVQAFWLSSLLTLLFNMRLHFLRLRPKLLVAGILVGVVPMLLQTVFGVLLLYGGIGGSRANGVNSVLDSWAQTFAAGGVPGAFTESPVVWDEATAPDEDGWQARLVRQWRAERLRALRRGGESGAADGTLPLPALADTTVYVSRGYDVWLTRLSDPAEGEARVEALLMDQHAFDSLARSLRADVFRLDQDVRDDWNAEGVTPTVLTEQLEGRFHPGLVDSTAGLWTRRQVFGAALVPDVEFTGDRLKLDDRFFLGLRTSLADLAREYASEDNPLTTGITVALGVIALLLMVAGLVAFIFSTRITGGITAAVKALHRGTRRLAAGDLDTHIELDNEDEFGDLARSFNEMTRAVKQGREDALARERLQQEMATARHIQERLLPHDQPLLAGWEVTGLSLPSLQVGGDYFDFIAAGDGRLGVAVGDVSGKGMPAALLMSNLQASLKGQIMHPAAVAETVSRVNDLLSESTDPNMFATFFYGELEASTGRFVCTNAGHDPGLVVRRDGSVEWLGTCGLILGMFAHQDYQQLKVDLAPGDILVLYTDGITEAGAPTPAEAAELGDDEVDDTQFGEERLAEVVAAAREQSALGIREAVLAAVYAHLGDRPQGDDITLVVIKRGEELAPARTQD